MHFRTSFLAPPIKPVLGALLWSAPGLWVLGAPASAQTLAPRSPANALITAVRADNITLSIGGEDGAQVGAIYEIRRGETFARLQILEVQATRSNARITDSTDGFTVTVGDNASFMTLRALPTFAAPAASSDLPAPTQSAAPNSPATSALNQIEKTVLPPIIANPTSALTGSTAMISAIENGTLTLNAGFQQGAKSGQTVPILRAGSVVGLARLSVVRADDSTATVLFVDEAAGSVTVGDAVGILGAASTLGVPSIQTRAPEKPRAPVPFESGASNLSVPKNDRSYTLLARLATSGLIRSQPPRVFHDDGARRHNTNEDVIFSRAQIAAFIREAMANANDAGSGDRAALQILVRQFRRDLEKSGSKVAELDALNARGTSVGLTTWSRATFAGGATDQNARDPFAESYGGRRSKSGFDTRLSAFGNLTTNLEFFASVDTGSSIRSQNDPGAKINNLFVRYDASKLLRGLTLELGRKEHWWGTGQFGTTVLGDAPGGLDSLQSSFKRGSYELRGIYARLGRGPAGGARSLYGQSAILNIGNSARVGVNTTIVSPKEGFDPKLFLIAFTPISLYTADRGEGNEVGAPDETNAVVNAFGEISVAQGARLYGEIVLDDISLNSNNSVENRNGSLVGIHLFNPHNPRKAGFKAEYARLNAQSYLMLRPQSTFPHDADYTYYQNGAPLGYPVAPRLPTRFGGAESLRFEAYLQPVKRLWFSGGIEFADINAEDQNPAQSGGRGFSRQQIYRASATYDLSRNWALTARAQRVATDQPNFIKFEKSVTQRFFSLEIARAF